MKRGQKEIIRKDLDEKMVLLTGPRQVGKTTLAKSLSDIWPNYYYLNFDSLSDKQIFIHQEWDRQAPLVIMDEIHKWKKWKTNIKGIYDTEGIPPRILVTGSARLDVYRRGGDSLAGRYFLHRLYPFSVAELKNQLKPQETLDALIRLGGFPEPFLSSSETKAKRWRKQYVERVVREDLQDLESVQNIQALLLLVEMLRERVGSSISYASLAGDIQVSPHTVKKWIAVLERMYILFTVTPYHKNIARAILKEPKIYFYDSGLVRGNNGKVLENIVAVSLLKHMHFLEDTKGDDTRLHYIRDKEKREVDFVMIMNGKMTNLIEVKLSEENVQSPLRYYHQKFSDVPCYQLVNALKKAKTVQGIHVQDAAKWLSELSV